MKRKMLALLLSALMLCAMFPLGVMSVSAEILSGTTGDCTWVLEDGDLTISGNGRMANYDADNPAPWNTDPWGLSLGVVIIEEGVTYIGENAFSSSNGFIMELHFPKSLMVIGNNAFLGTYFPASGYSIYAGTQDDMDKIVVGSGNDTLAYTTWIKNEIRRGTTGDCTWVLENGHLTISGDGAMADNYSPWGTAVCVVTIEYGVTHIGADTFSDMPVLYDVTIPRSVKTIGEEAFACLENLGDITIPESVTTIGDRAFEDCWNLYSINLPQSLTTIGDGAFNYCGYSLEVNYNGSILDYYNMEIGEDNDDLLNAEWYYNGTAKSTYSREVTHSVMDTENGNGLAFRFELNANGVSMTNVAEVDLTNATIRYGKYDYKLVTMGVVMSNRYSYPDLYDVNGVDTLDVPIVYLQEADEDSCAFAARIINIPDTQLERTIYARPYYIIEVDGEEFVVYGTTDRASCAEYM